MLFQLCGANRLNPKGGFFVFLADPLLSRLNDVRPAGESRWYARCPAHDDKSPSLSIRNTGEKVLLHCFAGCDPNDVLAAIGLDWKDIYPERWTCARLRPNEGAGKYSKRTTADFDQLDIERVILKIAANRKRNALPLNLEDEARLQVAVARIASIELKRTTPPGK